MRKIIIFFVLTSIGYVARSQTAEDTVKMAVNKLFETMKTGDTAMFKTCFADSAILQTISRNKEGKIIIMNEAVAEFADFISKQPKGAVDERISFDIIRIDSHFYGIFCRL